MRVITYSDPREIEKIKNWDQLKKIPHLCVSQTLVQGLSRKCSRDSFSILTTIDRFLNYFYKEWKKDSELSIKQFVEISDEIRKIENDKLRNTFLKNRGEVYKSIKLLKEADVVPNDLVEEVNNKEYIEFKKLYETIYNNPNWKALDYARDKDIEFIKLCYKALIIEDIITELESLKFIEKDSYKNITDEKILLNLFNNKMKTWNPENNKKNSFRRRDGYTNDEISIKRIKTSAILIENIDKINIKSIIIHGVHQFTPLIMRFIKQLESIGIEVIFLLNYNSNFIDVYSTWKKVYGWTNCEFELNKDVSEEYTIDLAKDYSKILLGDLESLSGKKYSYEVFDNLTEFGNYVANIYEKSSKEISNVKGRNGTRQEVLFNMDEQFYSVNGEEINELLSVYFPEQFGERHFLSYPIGQFILGLYDMWDFKEEKIKLNEKALKECLSINLWGNDKFIPITIYENLKSYFVGVENYDLYLNYINDLYKYSYALRNENNRSFNDYKHLSFFKAEPEEILFYKKIIEDIKNISEKLFKGKNRIDLKTHYKELMDIIKEKVDINKSISDKELQFVNEIFDSLSKEEESINSSVNEIRDTLHFYLKQRNEENGSNWIVRDFEQVDGGVLLADKDAREAIIIDGKSEKKSIYHYAEVCDNNMTSSKKKELPWPLKYEYFTEENEVIKINLLCKNEYSNFLKYTLFYGMYYLDRKYKISYIKNNTNDEEQTFFFPLRLLGLQEKPYYDKNEISVNYGVKEKRQVTEVIDDSEITAKEARMMSFCKKRFYYEGLIDQSGSYKTDFLCKQYIKVLFALMVRKEVSKGKSLEDVVKKRIDNGKKLIKAWERDFADITSYIFADINRNNQYSEIDEAYYEIKKEYLSRVFSSKDDRKEYVAKCINKNELEKFKNQIIDYIKSDYEEYYNNNRLNEKCNYCKYRELCTYIN